MHEYEQRGVNLHFSVITTSCEKKIFCFILRGNNWNLIKYITWIHICGTHLDVEFGAPQTAGRGDQVPYCTLHDPHVQLFNYYTHMFHITRGRNLHDGVAVHALTYIVTVNIDCMNGSDD